jgi:hypothetical protein
MWNTHSKKQPLIPASKITHSDLLRSICKITSYLTVGKPEEAHKWADILREQLKELGL